MTYSFDLSYNENGCFLELRDQKVGFLERFKSRQKNDLSSLIIQERNLAMAIAKLRVLDRDNKEHDIQQNKIWISHRLVSEIDYRSANSLGLPETISNISFKAEMRGSIGSPDFKLAWWWDKGGRTLPIRRIGAIIEDIERLMRIPAPIFKAINIAESFDSNSSLTDHWLALGEFRRSLGIINENLENQINLEGALKQIEVITSDCIGLKVYDEDDSNFDALPYIHSLLIQRDQADALSAIVQNTELRQFQYQVKSRGAQPAYQISKGKFLILDPTAIPVVQVIADAAKGTPDQRRAFIRDAERIISETIEQQAIRDGRLNELMSPEAYAERLEKELGSAWTETKEWASRVISISEWTRPDIDKLQGSGTTWLPPTLALELGEILGRLTDDEIEPLIAELNKCFEHGNVSFIHRVGEITASNVVIEALSRRLEMIQNKKEIISSDNSATVYLPISHSNFWDNDFKAQIRPRSNIDSMSLPNSITTQMEPHQLQALEWQIKSWSYGIPGVLNADEQGLGKTLQTLSFMTWLAEKMIHGEFVTQPMLIVAPTSLLRNWEAECNKHISPGFWDEPIRIYGQHIAKWKLPRVKGRDIDDGKSRLDLTDLINTKKPKIVITTYQTLANYAVTFAQTRFSIAVFDEIQNLKNPVSMRSEAAKAVMADFRIGLTGTPVENATRDIWAIIDQLFPGALGPMAEFRRSFDLPDENRMRLLHAAIFTGTDKRPAIGLRRMKKDTMKNLPPKVRVLHPRIMPEVQAIRYDEVRAKGGGMFALLHHIRRTSLHPGLIDGENPEDFTLSSARITAVMDILRYVKSKNERVLIFVENRDVQAWFAELIKIEFNLPRIYLINGDTGVDARKDITDRFQNHLHEDGGFDVLILGPRAAGTGLTLTAANHVIHLTRWWNPAVEEQCNDRTHRIGQNKPVTIHIPLAIHPRLGRNSFDCLLQRLMKRKRGIADAVLWPQEIDESELLTIYSTILNKEADDEYSKNTDFTLSDRPDLKVKELDKDIIRVATQLGGSSVVIANKASIDKINKILHPSDAAIIMMGQSIKTLSHETNPISILPDNSLWPEYVLPE